MKQDFKKVLVTGGTGMMATHLYQHLRRIAPDLSVWIYSRRTGGDVRDYDMLEKAIEGKDIVYNLAANTHVDYSYLPNIEDRQSFVSTNMGGTVNVLKACETHKVKLVHVSTSEVLGHNVNPGQAQDESHPLQPVAGIYAATKTAADHMCRIAMESFGQDVVIIRPFNVWGTYQSVEKVIPKFISQAGFGLPITVNGSGEQKRDYLYCPDLVDALWRLRLVEPTIVHCGTEHTFTINAVADAVSQALGNTGMITHLDKSESRKCEVIELFGSYQKLKRLTGWEPTTIFPNKIDEVARWYITNGIITPPKLSYKG